MNEILQLRASFVEKSINEEDQSLIIKGYASTVNKDRVGDVIEASAWGNGGLNNYLKNPVILAYHDHKRPIGKMVDYSIDSLGLKITAKISKAAGDITNLIQDGVLQAFSVGVRVKEADYDNETDTFLIKDVELHEVSVVAVPANQDSLFSIAKCFDTETGFAEFKQKFVKTETSGNSTEQKPEDKKEEFIMDSNELQEMIAKTISTELSKQKEEAQLAKAAKEAEAARKQEIVTIAKSGAEAIVDDLRKSMKDSEVAFATKLAELQNEIVAKSEEITRITRDRSKVEFADRQVVSNVVTKEAVNAALLSKILSKPIQDTAYGKSILEKAVNDSSSWRVASDKWEQELGTTIENEMLLSLRIAPLFREIQLNARTQVLTVNPDMSNVAAWVTAGETGHVGGDVDQVASNRTAASTDPEVYKNLTEISLTAPKMAAKAFLTDETEEDALIPVLPLIQEGLVRAHARKVENALIYDTGAGTGTTNRIVGLNQHATNVSTGSTTISVGASAKATGLTVVTLRRLMGKYGIDPTDLVGVVSVDAWYDLLEDPNFADVIELGANAQKLTGQVGSMYGVPFIVSPEITGAKTAGSIAMMLINTRNYLIPRRRGVTVQSWYDVEKQRKVLVATQRWGFNSIMTTATSVAVAKYAA